MPAMGSLFDRVARLASSPQGRQAVNKAVNQARDYAQRPETKQRLEQVRQRVIAQSRKRSGTN